MLQGRPGEARVALVDVPETEPADVQARALVVRAVAEERLGDAASAERLMAHAQRLAPDDRLVKHIAAAQIRPGQSSVPGTTSPAS